jgi:ureidoacrylate peracid hydrolase
MAKSELTYEPELTGLLIVDPYNDFLSEGGQALRTQPLDTRVEQCCRAYAAGARRGSGDWRAGLHRPAPSLAQSDPYEHWKTMPPIQASAAAGHIFADGTWGGSFHPDFEPRAGEVVAQEHWLSSGFANTDLDLQLKKHGLRNVIVIGMRANTCIESTVRFVAELGYEVTLVKDAIGSFGHAEMEASLQFNMPAYASAVVSTDEIVAKLSV